MTQSEYDRVLDRASLLCHLAYSTGGVLVEPLEGSDKCPYALLVTRGTCQPNNTFHLRWMGQFESNKSWKYTQQTIANFLVSGNPNQEPVLSGFPYFSDDNA